MKELLFKSLICLIAVVFLVNLVTAISYAENDNFSLDKYGNDAEPSDDVSDVIGSTRTIIGAGVGVIRIIGTGVALIMITVIAIKYLMAAPGDRADLKKSSIQYVIGAVIVFASTNLLDILIEAVPRILSND